MEKITSPTEPRKAWAGVPGFKSFDRPVTVREALEYIRGNFEVEKQPLMRMPERVMTSILSTGRVPSDITFDEKWKSLATNRKFVSGTPEIVWLKNYDEFVAWFEIYSQSTDRPFPTLICFDHDLGEELTGFDCVKHLVNFCIDKKIGLPYCTCHSSNPVGRENILSYIESYRKSLQ